MHFAKLNKPPLSFKAPLKSAWENKSPPPTPPGGLTEDLRYPSQIFHKTLHFVTIYMKGVELWSIKTIILPKNKPSVPFVGKMHCNNEEKIHLVIIVQV